MEQEIQVKLGQIYYSMTGAGIVLFFQITDLTDTMVTIRRIDSQVDTGDKPILHRVHPLRNKFIDDGDTLPRVQFDFAHKDGMILLWEEE